MSTEEQFRELLRKHIKKSRSGLKPTSTEPNVMDLVKEGDKLLADEAKQQTKEIQKAASTKTKNNPYFQASLNVLERYPAWRRNEILEMEKSGNKSNRLYEDYVKIVVDEGDKLYDQQKNSH